MESNKIDFEDWWESNLDLKWDNYHLKEEFRRCWLAAQEVNPHSPEDISYNGVF